MNVNNARYALKYLFAKKPIVMVCIFSALTTVVTTIVLTIVERPGASETGVNNYVDALWLSLITMSTVGYVPIRVFFFAPLGSRVERTYSSLCLLTIAYPSLLCVRISRLTPTATATSSRRRIADASHLSSAA